MSGPSKDRLSKAEIRKDALQEGVTAASQAVGSVATIITTAVGEIAKTVGGFATEMFEIRDSARRASADHGADQGADQGADHEEHDDQEPTTPLVAEVVEDQPNDI